MKVKIKKGCKLGEVTYYCNWTETKESEKGNIYFTLEFEDIEYNAYKKLTKSNTYIKDIEFLTNKHLKNN